MYAKLATALVACVLFGGLPAAAQDENGDGRGDRLVLENGEIVVVLVDRSPYLEVRNADDPSQGFQVSLRRLVELGGDDGRSPVASFDLLGGEWEVDKDDLAQGTRYTLTQEGPIEPVEGPLPLPISGLTEGTPGNASVRIEFTLYRVPVALRSGSDAFDVSLREVKFDVAVDRWDWASPDDRLALEFAVDEGQEIPTSDRNESEGADDEEGNQVTVGSRAGDRIGFVRWVASASATTGNDTEAVDVEHVEGDGSHWLVYDAPGFGSLVHDPTVGVFEEEEGRPGAGGEEGADDRDVPAPAVGFVALAVTLAAFALGRRR
ncbi:MAG: hypothetical protein ACT4PT_06135 [Methanobacteriota archaeon]